MKLFKFETFKCSYGGYYGFLRFTWPKVSFWFEYRTIRGSKVSVLYKDKFVCSTEKLSSYFGFVKILLPSVYSMSVFCCDAREYSYYGHIFTFNDWHANKRYNTLKEASDGPMQWTKVSFAEYLKASPSNRY